MNSGKDVAESIGNRVRDCQLAKQFRDMDLDFDFRNLRNYPGVGVFGKDLLHPYGCLPIKGLYEHKDTIEMMIIKNKIDGIQREKDVENDLKKAYPPEKGYVILSEVYLRDKEGNIVKDPATGEARRIDFVVAKDGKVVDSIEVTSKTSDKTNQTAKEGRIRESGGNYVRDNNGRLVEMPSDVSTRIERRD